MRLDSPTRRQHVASRNAAMYPCEIPSKFALIEYVLECASDVGFCMKPPKTIGDSQKNDTFLLVHACTFCGVCLVFALAGMFFHR